MERMQRRTEALEIELRAATDRELSARKSLDTHRGEIERDVAQLREALLQKTAEEEELLSLLEQRDVEAADAAETIQRLTMQLEMARYSITHECVTRSTHEQLLKDFAELEGVSVHRSRLLAAEEEVRLLRRSLDTDYVPLEKYEQLRREYDDLHQYVRHETVAVSAFTDVVVKYDELEASVQNNFISKAVTEELDKKLQDCRDEKSRLQQSLATAESQLTQALAHASAQQERLTEATEGWDRARTEARRVQDVTDDLWQQLQAVASERDHFASLHAQVTGSVQRLEADNAALLVQLGNIRGDLSSMQRHARSASVSNNTMNASLASASAATIYPAPMTLPMSVPISVPSPPMPSPPRGLNGPTHAVSEDIPCSAADGGGVYVWQRRRGESAQRRSEDWQRPDLFAASPVQSPSPSKQKRGNGKVKKTRSVDLSVSTEDGRKVRTSAKSTLASKSPSRSPKAPPASAYLHPVMSRSHSNLSTTSITSSITSAATPRKRTNGSPRHLASSRKGSDSSTAIRNRTPTRMSSFPNKS